MNYLVLILSITFSISSMAYKSQSLDISIKPSKALSQVKKNSWHVNLDTREADRKLKREIQMGQVDIDPISSPDFIVGLAKESGEFSQEAKVETAKQLARIVLLKQLEKKWKDIQPTILNAASNEKFSDFSQEISKTLNQKTIYQGRHKEGSQNFFEFRVADWAFVQIATNLKLANIVIQFDNAADDNKIDPSVKDIKTLPNDSTSNKSNLNF